MWSWESRRDRRVSRRGLTVGGASVSTVEGLMASFPPILLLHGSQRHGGRVQAGDLEIDAAFRADEDLAHLGVRLQGYGCRTFGTCHRLHSRPPAFRGAPVDCDKERSDAVTLRASASCRDTAAGAVPPRALRRARLCRGSKRA